MKATDVLSVLERSVAPVALSRELCEKYGAYDNSGIILDCGENLNGVLFCLDLTPAAVAKAQSLRYDLIVTHHPAIFCGIKNISAAQGSPTQPLYACARAGISVISMHLNFDAAPAGIDRYLMLGLGGERETAIMQPLSSGGYGRVFKVPASSFAAFGQRVAQTFKSTRCRFYGSGRAVNVVASFCGAGCDEASIAFALSNGADTFVSADIKHHHITAMLQAGLNVVELTHYCSEVYGFERIYSSVNGLISLPSAFFEEQSLL